ncbi:MAG: hypothetical protein P8J33_11650, partial [Pirellulaceae bacterium]|nr:hypothetical protein [Pirellulaceae bacterium]
MKQKNSIEETRADTPDVAAESGLELGPGSQEPEVTIGVGGLGPEDKTPNPQAFHEHIGDWIGPYQLI